MKVLDLINILETCPDNAEVAFSSEVFSLPITIEKVSYTEGQDIVYLEE